MEKNSNKKIIIAIVCVVALVAAGILGYLFLAGKGDNEELVYVTKISVITGQNANGLNNRYAGVVEAEESWSATLDPNLTVKEVLVSVNQKVEEGTPLFTYDTTEVTDSLNSAKIELERLQNELSTLKTSVEDLIAQRDGTSDEGMKAQYSVEIKQAQLDVTAKEYDITSKQEEIKKLEETLSSATVESKIAGVVKSIAGESDSPENDDYITIVNLNRFQIRGEVNEQNLASLSENLPVIVFSRVDDNKHWKGTITKVDTGSDRESDAEGMETKSMYVSSAYPFYISVEDSTGLNIGQHVYIELDKGQLEGKKEGLWLEEYYIDQTDADHPVVWTDQNGRIKKQEVTLGSYDGKTMKYEITEGLLPSDMIAMPYEGLREGLKTTETDNESGDYTGGEDDWVDEEMGDIPEIDEEDDGISDEDFDPSEFPEVDEEILDSVDEALDE
ncbi:MAG: efflux RND transporter periplasmic adaptor subunit [Lachnospiraceae bacterium]|nr:efflux RND transporter periplasmic adaptor subunit [Lachnospiraceae bacterium]